MLVPIRPGRPRKHPSHGASVFATVLPVVRTRISMNHSRQNPMALRMADHMPEEFGSAEAAFKPLRCAGEGMTDAPSWHFHDRNAMHCAALCRLDQRLAGR